MKLSFINLLIQIYTIETFKKKLLRNRMGWVYNLSNNELVTDFFCHAFLQKYLQLYSSLLASMVSLKYS